ncbi:MAG: Asp-tRNA(Asn)/Glu-tRNA(Gln) amidotransferase subunit GatC [Methanococcoides sp.]|nr:Asp-tRNA(Asn)/Glu-tRNA(Gln) amidotransferase subunit GatC [Methanococcoides sp.]
MITKDEVEHVGWLARIAIDDAEAEDYAVKLSSVLDYFGQLDEVDTEGVEPTYHVADIMNVFREDVVTPSLDQKDVLTNTAEEKDGYIKAPRII